MLGMKLGFEYEKGAEVITEDLQ